ncbi:MAG: hypothetical protein AB1546_05400 [bacterium]
MTQNDDVFNRVDEGYELLYNGDYLKAMCCFTGALEKDFTLGDAYRGIGEIYQNLYDHKLAKKFFNKAIQVERKNLGGDAPDGYTWWLDIDTRPYLRAREALAFFYWDMGEYKQAIREFREILKRNRNDNQGVRFHIPSLYLLMGDLHNAMHEFELYEQSYPDDIPDPFILYNRALTLYSLGPIREAVGALRAAFFSNMYVPSLILIQMPPPADIYFKINLEEPEYAMEYCRMFRELWLETPGAISLLDRLWNHSEIASDVTQYLQIKRDMAIADSEKRAERLQNIAENIENKKASESLLFEIEQSFRNGDFTMETDERYFEEQEQEAMGRIVAPIEGAGKPCTPRRFVDLLYGLLHYEGILTLNDAFFYLCDVLGFSPGVTYREMFDLIDSDERFCTAIPDVVHRKEVEHPEEFIEIKLRCRPEYPREYTIEELDAALRGETAPTEDETKLLELMGVAGRNIPLEILRKTIRNTLFMDLQRCLRIREMPKKMHKEIMERLERVWLLTPRYELWGSSPAELISAAAKMESELNDSGGKVTPFRRPTEKL